MKKKILIVAPHPDDEIIGVGGFMAKAIGTGNKVDVLYLSSGDSIEDIREQEAEAVCDYMGVNSHYFLRLKDNTFKVSAETIKHTIDSIQKSQPDLIFCNHKNDADFEHRIAYQLINESFWRYNQSAKRRAKGLILYEVHKPLQTYSLVEDISAQIDKKMEALSLYKSQLIKSRLDLAIKGLNQYRGLLHENCEFAEVFQIKRYSEILEDF